MPAGATPTRVVIDTNVLVSWFLSPAGNPARVVGLAVSGALVPCYDQRMLAAYREVLARPRFGIDPQAVNLTLLALRNRGLDVAAAPVGGALVDESDRPFIEVAGTVGAWLVTGNMRHFEGRPMAVTPADFLRILPGLGVGEPGSLMYGF